MKSSNKLLDVLYKYNLSKKLVYQILNTRAKGLADTVSPYLNKGDLILDIGPASCTVTEALIKQDLRVFPLDIENFSIVDTVLPTIYDGYRMPFKDNQFETSLILFVLHHTPDPIKVLIEAKRVSRKILVFEDIITSPIHKFLTASLDSLMNLEFYNQPHTNKRDDEWKSIFSQLGLKVSNQVHKTSAAIMKHALYVLEK
ncbi:MAG: methyltransferase domain-containing protein [Anaerolineales bacterium]|nr:methyltransferase domain-containing protein [Anaerolineales bacterium]